jgi:hypothetical protein
MAVHEKYTTQYIAREAALIIRYFSPYLKRGGFGRAPQKLSPQDFRILERWGITRMR